MLRTVQNTFVKLIQCRITYVANNEMCHDINIVNILLTLSLYLVQPVYSDVKMSTALLFPTPTSLTEKIINN